MTETPATSNPQSACAGEEAGQSAEEVQQQRTASSAFAKLLLTAKTLYANAEGCAVNHYGDDFATHGLPGWLSDCAADIQVAEQALANPSPAGGVREALTLTMKVNEGIDATLFTAGGVYVGAIRDIEIARQIVAALSSPATPEPVSAPAGEVVANIIKKHARISIDQDWEGMRYAILGIDEAAREIAALSKHEAKS